MIHLRLIVVAELVDAVLEEVRDGHGVAHVMHLPDASVSPAGDVVLCDVVRESANDLIERLQDLGVHRSGAISSSASDTVVSDAAARAESDAPGHGADALIWEEIEAQARDDATVTVSYLVLMVVAALIAAIGILLDAPILIVGAMVVGPEYAPLSSMCVAGVRRRWGRVAVAAGALGTGLAVAAVATFATVLVFRFVGLVAEEYQVTSRELTAFISRPDGMAAVVAVLAGIVGMLSLTESRSGALVGVLVSVTTIPAVANVGVGAAYGAWGEVLGATLQLLINITGLVVAGIVTLVVQERVTTRRRGRRAREAGAGTGSR